MHPRLASHRRKRRLLGLLIATFALALSAASAQAATISVDQDCIKKSESGSQIGSFSGTVSDVAPGYYYYSYDYVTAEPDSGGPWDDTFSSTNVYVDGSGNATFSLPRSYNNTSVPIGDSVFVKLRRYDYYTGYYYEVIAETEVPVCAETFADPTASLTIDSSCLEREEGTGYLAPFTAHVTYTNGDDPSPYYYYNNIYVMAEHNPGATYEYPYYYEYGYTTVNPTGTTEADVQVQYRYNTVPEEAQFVYLKVRQDGRWNFPLTEVKVPICGNDPDTDGDGVLDSVDNCDNDANAGQANNDGDAEGDACDADDDNDTVNDGGDNCQFTANPGQANNDADAEGDACDADDDNDTVNDGGDNCQFTANTDQANNDGDADGDACDPDDDNDTVNDGGDNCQFTANTNQANNDGDANGDACDADDDNDTVADSTDNCQFTANTDQENNDADAQGDACDADDDNDGLNDGSDNCQFAANPAQRDDDNDGVGDACDGTFNSSNGKANGGGYVLKAGEKVNFSASAKSIASQLDGTCVVTVNKTKIKCLTVDGYFQSATSDRVVFVGSATHDGVVTRYRIEMTDNGEPGKTDRFEITTDSGFAAGGVIGGGNVQVHKGA